MVSREKVIQRLNHFGCTITPDDYDQIDFELEKTINYVLNYCNFPSVNDIPELLDVRIIDRVCYEYLFYQKNSQQLEGFDYETAIKEIKEGDTTIKYVTGQSEDTPENRFDSYVKQLKQGFDKWLTPHRRIRW